MNQLQVQNLTVQYGSVEVFQQLNWNWELDGKLLGIIGPNGSGKSTLVNACLGLIPLEEGEIRFNGKPLKEAYGLVSYVPQKNQVDADFPITVEEIVRMGRMSGRNWLYRWTAADKEEVQAAMEKTGVLDLRKRQIGQLSGGQRQRVFLARALARKSQFLFLDEPFAGVDMASEEKIMQVLRETAASGTSIVVVHHDLHAVIRYFDYLLILNQGIVDFGETASVFNKDNLLRTYGNIFPFIHDLG